MSSRPAAAWRDCTDPKPRFTLDPSLNLSTIASTLPFTYTGADLYALCSDAMLKAVTRSARAVDDRIAVINRTRQASQPPKPAITVAQFFDYHATEADLDVLVTEQDFVQANGELVPSVSAEELGHYERVRRDFEGDRTKADGPSNVPVGSRPGSPPTQEDLEAWQAAKIEELIRSGFADGSLARNNPKKGKGPSNQSNGGDDDLIVRTGSLNIAESNGSGGGSGSMSSNNRHRESRFFGGSSNGSKERSKDKAKRAMSIFSSSSSKGKGRSDAPPAQAPPSSSASPEFGDGARDQDLY